MKRSIFWLPFWCMLCSLITVSAAIRHNYHSRIYLMPQTGQQTIGRSGQTGTSNLGRSGQSGSESWGRTAGGGPPPPPPSTREDLYLPSQVDGPCVYAGGVTTDLNATLPVNCMATYLSATPAPGAIVSVSTVAQLNTAIANLACGQIVEINDTAVLQQNNGWTFPNLACDNAHWIWITTNGRSNVNFPAEHQRATPCAIGKASIPNYPTYNCTNPLTLMPTLESTGGLATINFASGANHYRFFGIFFPQFATNARNANGLFNAGGGNHIILERSLLQGAPFGCTISGVTWSCPATDTTLGVTLAGSTYAAVMYTWIFDIGGNGSFSDAAGIQPGGNGCGAPGSEDVKFIFGNMDSAVGENYIAGGGGCGANTVTPNDMIIENNHFYKNPVWALCLGTGSGGGCHGTHPEFKNNGEIKNFNRVLVEGNVYENSWTGWQTDQSGFLSLLTPKNQGISSTVNATSDSTGTILTGSFPAAVVDPNCAHPNHCTITFPSGSGGTSTQAQSWTATSITVSPAVAAVNTTAAAKACVVGANPNATDTNITYRYNHFINGHNGIQLAAFVSDCGDRAQGLNSFSMHDNLFEGLSTTLNTGIAADAGQKCFDNENGQGSPANLHNFSEVHNTCAMDVGEQFGHSGLDVDLDSTITPSTPTGSYWQNMTIANNLAPAGGLGESNQGGIFPGGQAAWLAQAGCNPPGSGTCTWTYAGNVLGLGQWPSQTNNTPFPSTNITCGSATCFPSGSAFTNIFTQYSSGGVVGLGGNYVINPSSVYINAGTDGKNPGIQDWTSFNNAIAGVRNITNYAPIQITTTSFPQAVINTAYTQVLNGSGASGVNGYLRWSILSGSLPAGLQLQAPGNCGATVPFSCITGTPTATGSSTFTLKLEDAEQQIAQMQYTLTVNTGGIPSANPSWTLVTIPSAVTQMVDFTINQNNHHLFVVDRNNGVWRSPDFGQTWTQINTGLPLNSCGTGASNVCGWTIKWNPHNNSLVMNESSAPNASGHSHFFISTDEATWNQIPEPAGFSISGALGAGSFSGGLMPPATGGIMLLGGIGCSNSSPSCVVMGSTTDGATTFPVATNPAEGKSESFGLNGSLYGLGGEAAGFYVSTDGANTFNVVWSCVSGVGPSCNSVNDSNEVYTNQADANGNWLLSTLTGVWRSNGPTSNPTSWTHLYASNQRSRTLFIDSLGSYYFGQAQASSAPTVARSIDTGTTWTNWSGAIGNSLEAHRFIEDKTTGNVCAIIENGSTNVGALWCTPK